MFELLILLLIVWLIKRGNGKNKKLKKLNKRSVPVGNTQNTLKTFADQLIKAATETNQKLQNQEKPPVYSSQLGEGRYIATTARMEEEFRGSMQTDSTEGECLCDPELEHERIQEIVPESVYTNEIGNEPLIDYSVRGLVQGFVMGEILTRPAQRIKRR